MTNPRDDTYDIKILLEAHGLRSSLADGLYVLDDDGNPIRCDDLLTWANWMETGHRVIAHDLDEADPHCTISVSTVFLGLDHNRMPHGEPVLWETMVFGGPLHHQCDRYRSRDAALDGHRRMCLRVWPTAAGQ